MSQRKHKTTIGIPVYNEIRFIEKTLYSAVGQADQIIISDNASTDGTSEICRRFAQKHPQITYFRHDTTQSAHENFLNCMQLAENDYFMWLGGHDIISQNYVAALERILNESDAILAYTNSVHLSQEYAFTKSYFYDFHEELVHDSSLIRIKAIIEKLNDCTLYYGLFKKDFLCNAFASISDSYVYGIDHGVLCAVAALGKMQLAPDATYYRIEPRTADPSCYQRWTRVLKAYYGAAYNDSLVPGIVPLDIANVQFSIARNAVKTAPIRDEYLKLIGYILLSRWGVDAPIAQTIAKSLDALSDNAYAFANVLAPRKK